MYMKDSQPNKKNLLQIMGMNLVFQKIGMEKASFFEKGTKTTKFETLNFSKKNNTKQD